MRENFDYVTMENYSADMAENTQRAIGIIAGLKRRAEDAERLIAHLVLAAGGKIEIHDQQLYSLEQVDLTVWRNDADMSRVWQATRK